MCALLFLCLFLRQKHTTSNVLKQPLCGFCRSRTGCRIIESRMIHLADIIHCHKLCRNLDGVIPCVAHASCQFNTVKQQPRRCTGLDRLRPVNPAVGIIYPAATVVFGIIAVPHQCQPLVYTDKLSRIGFFAVCNTFSTSIILPEPTYGVKFPKSVPTSSLSLVSASRITVPVSVSPGAYST